MGGAAAAAKVSISPRWDRLLEGDADAPHYLLEGVLPQEMPICLGWGSELCPCHAKGMHGARGVSKVWRQCPLGTQVTPCEGDGSSSRCPGFLPWGQEIPRDVQQPGMGCPGNPGG